MILMIPTNDKPNSGLILEDWLGGISRMGYLRNGVIGQSVNIVIYRVYLIFARLVALPSLESQALCLFLPH